ncbi:hypothetical protein EYF80_023682 [Liparis tanakae]|uniref:Uncharacterized protein n=1 Tax=Liparis tanakae TaxID=230148 RepID=A0A4Z2HM81_9TELE|nr:hypothetical protein EYF80_023682 [Liparis tanakae]
MKNSVTAKNRLVVQPPRGVYLLHAVALSLVAQGRQAEQVEAISFLRMGLRLWKSLPLQIGRETPVHVAQKFCIQRKVLL